MSANKGDRVVFRDRSTSPHRIRKGVVRAFAGGGSTALVYVEELNRVCHVSRAGLIVRDA